MIQRFIRRAYEWTMKWADHPYGHLFTYFISFIEAAFFIIPPDPLLVAIGIQRPKRALIISFYVAVASVLGGLLGYLIGSTLWSILSPFFFEYIISPEVFEQASKNYQDNAIATLIVVGFTPIPFKAFTVAAGAIKVPIGIFVVGCFIGRSLRYMSIGLAIYLLGDKAKGFIDKYLEKIAIACGLLVAVAYILYRAL